jgi:hypothetical protein
MSDAEKLKSPRRSRDKFSILYHIALIAGRKSGGEIFWLMVSPVLFAPNVMVVGTDRMIPERA